MPYSACFSKQSRGFGNRTWELFMHPSQWLISTSILLLKGTPSNFTTKFTGYIDINGDYVPYEINHGF